MCINLTCFNFLVHFKLVLDMTWHDSFFEPWKADRFSQEWKLPKKLEWLFGMFVIWGGKNTHLFSSSSMFFLAGVFIGACLQLRVSSTKTHRIRRKRPPKINRFQIWKATVESLHWSWWVSLAQKLAVRRITRIAGWWHFGCHDMATGAVGEGCFLAWK